MVYPLTLIFNSNFNLHTLTLRFINSKRCTVNIKKVVLKFISVGCEKGSLLLSYFSDKNLFINKKKTFIRFKQAFGYI